MKFIQIHCNISIFNFSFSFNRVLFQYIFYLSNDHLCEIDTLNRIASKSRFITQHHSSVFVCFFQIGEMAQFCTRWQIVVDGVIHNLSSHDDRTAETMLRNQFVNMKIKLC